MTCEACGERLATKRGLSTHELHRHPEVRKDKRKAVGANQGENRPGKRASAWSKEETDLLVRLNERYTRTFSPWKDTETS